MINGLKLGHHSRDGASKQYVSKVIIHRIIIPITSTFRKTTVQWRDMYMVSVHSGTHSGECLSSNHHFSSGGYFGRTEKKQRNEILREVTENLNIDNPSSLKVKGLCTEEDYHEVWRTLENWVSDRSDVMFKWRFEPGSDEN